jgi:hypothetical protein
VSWLLLAAAMAPVPAALPAAAAVTSGNGHVPGAGGGISRLAPGLDFVQEWARGPFAGDRGNPIAMSSPVVATLDDYGPAVVVGDRSGYVYAFHLDGGTRVAGWPTYDGGAPIDSTPSVEPTGGSALDTVFVGEGNAAAYRTGGYAAFAPDGHMLWQTRVVEPPTDKNPAYAVQASMTVAELQGRPAVFAGSLGQEAYALDATNGATLTGWPFFSADSVFSTAAAADLYGNGHTELVVGGASTHGFALGQGYHSGGHLRVLDSRGGLVCHADLNQEVDSSPAVGGFLAGGATGIAVGTGSFYAGATDSNVLNAFGSHCNLVWSDTLDGFTGSSPALADLSGTGALDVVEGTDNGAAGSVWALDGSDGSTLWHVYVGGRVIGGVVTADLSGQGYQDVLVPTTHGVDVLDGRNGYLLDVLAPNLGFQSSPLVTEDPNGTAGVTLAGYDGADNEGVVLHYDIPGSNGALAVGAGSWPMFHHDPQLTGTTGAAQAPSGSPCDVPSAANNGYDLVSSEGAVYSFGQPDCGSAGAGAPRSPAAGIAMSPAVGGYWLALADGAVLAFGSASDFGSMFGHHLNSPVTGIAATPDGRGYWLVSADGGVFGFGDANYYGSPPSPSARIVGIASSPDGHGYVLAGADGSVYEFGDAQFYGSMAGRHLNSPVVGVTEDDATGGYWLLAADGGVFAYGAPYEGSAGAIDLAAPMVAMASTTDGRGYWLIARDGGVFAYGDAPYRGSAAGRTGGVPIAAAAGYSG